MAANYSYRIRSASAVQSGRYDSDSAELLDLSTKRNRTRPTNRSAGSLANCTIPEETSASSSTELEGSNSSRQENGPPPKRVFFKSESSLRILVWIVKLVMLTAVLVCLVLSKLTMVEMTGMLYSLQSDNTTTASNAARQSQPYYWMLLLAVMIPDVFTWIYTLSAGVLMNRTTQPWPRMRSLILGIGVAATEAVAVCLMLFAVMPTLPPAINILLISGLFSVQGARNLITLCFYNHYLAIWRALSRCWILCRKFRCCHGYIPLVGDADDSAAREEHEEDVPATRFQKYKRRFELGASIVAQIVGLGLQVVGLTSIMIMLIDDNKSWRWFGLLVVVSCLLLSFCWCDQVQRWTFARKAPKPKPHRRTAAAIPVNTHPADSSSNPERNPTRKSALAPTARLTTTFIAATVRLVLYPFISYAVFYFLYMHDRNANSDPWGIHVNSTFSDGWKWSSHDVAVFFTHLVCSASAFILSCFACYMTIHRAGLAIPTLLATPFSLAIYFISSENGVNNSLDKFSLFPFQLSNIEYFKWGNWVGSFYHAIFYVAILLWLGQLLVSAAYLLQKDNAILARFEDMFVRPTYNSIFLEQFLILNRHVSHKPRLMQIDQEGVRTKATVFICSTMYRENSTEMTQMLKSIGRIAKHASRERQRGNPDDEYDTFESHIFFDGGCKADQPTEFAIQLLGLVPEALKDLGVTLKSARGYQTPYGYRFTWYLKEVVEGEEEKEMDRREPQQYQEQRPPRLSSYQERSQRPSSYHERSQRPSLRRNRAPSVNVHDTLRQRDFFQSVLMPQVTDQLPGDEGEWPGMPFVIHLKDNAKVKNKKRWSQVMYMKYIIEHRILKNMEAWHLLEDQLPQTDSMTLDNTYILTTDADIDFQAESALVLLDMLARDPKVGAVCARTHPLGYGPLYWYQIFDYAVGHWLLKAAEHILGSVLCCPGCFSVFRCRALRNCLKTYSEEVTNAMEFLTKDMGEDRWLSTLLVKNGWKLEYCAISNDHTYCPNEFDEFFKQRRRWIPSTIANLWLLISDAKTFTQRNPAITYPFILFEALILFSTMISPATVILLIAYGMESSFHISSIPAVIILVLISVGYGFVCVFSKNQQLQLDIAKVLTFVFSIVMAVVVAGLVQSSVTNIIDFAFPNNTADEATPAPLPCPNNTCNPNLTIDSFDLVNGTAVSFQFPIGLSTIYLIAWVALYPITSLLHIDEFFYFLHLLWYLLGLPSGYLLLLIYSIANLNNRSWGTREKVEATESMVGVLWTKVSQKLLKMLRLVEDKKPEKGKEEETEADKEQRPPDKGDQWDRDRPGIDIDHHHGLEEEEHSMALEESQQPCEYPWLKQWLERLESEAFYINFARTGYTQEWYVAEMTEKDLVAIGVRPAGFVHHLAAAIKTMKITPISPGIPKTVGAWINGLQMSAEPESYVGRFYRAGYKEHDVENLSRITAKELQEDMHITKPAHLKRFMQALSVLREATDDEQRNRVTEELIHTAMRQDHYLRNDPELAFWMEAVDDVLRPIPEGFKQSNQLQASLRQLRNTSLVALLLVNVLWMTILLTLKITQLDKYGLPEQVIGTLFLVVYGVILVVQFIAMLIHRATTLAHYMARLNRNLRISPEENLAQSMDVTYSWTSDRV